MKYRHGDVSFHPITKKEGKLIKHDGSFILALGEATGHHHKIAVMDVADMEIRETAAGFILVLKSEGTLTHQEHGTLKIGAGTYRIGKEREYDWFSMATRRVID